MITRVYPRACGGTCLCHSFFPFLWGLSPRLRGNADFIASVTAAVGSIPALAGERNGDGDQNGFFGVYPRACGGTFEVGWRRV